MATEQVETSCRSCGATLIVEPGLRTAHCPYCDSPAVVDRPVTPDRPDPVFVIGFTVPRDRATSRMKQYIRRHRLGPFGLRGRTAERVSGIYLPIYLYSAVAKSRYTATIAEQYERVKLGKRRNGATVWKVREIEYRQLAGRHAVNLGNVVVTASRGVANHEVEAIEPYELDGLRRYVPQMISGWTSEEPSLGREQILGLARAEARAEIATRLRRFMPGDGHSDLAHQTELLDETLDLALLPVWVFAIRYHEQKPPIRLLVNGQTGRVAGKIPNSRSKLAFIVAGLLLGAWAVWGLAGWIVELLR